MSDRDPGPALLHLLVRDATASGVTFRDPSITTVDWASATFVGHRHRIDLRLAGADPARWLAALPEAEWTLPGHIVVDVGVEAIAPGRVALAALTIRECPPSPGIGVDMM